MDLIVESVHARHALPPTIDASSDKFTVDLHQHGGL
jgi:hypothetical protein